MFATPFGQTTAAARTTNAARTATSMLIWVILQTEMETGGNVKQDRPGTRYDLRDNKKRSGRLPLRGNADIIASIGRMPMQFRFSPTTLQECSTEEWEARLDLAAAHRLAVMHGFNEGIFNHLTFVVPGHSDRYYQIPFGMHWSEVKASSFMEVGIDDGKVRRGGGDGALLLLHPCADP